MHSQYASSSYMIAVDQHCWYQLVYELLQRKSHAAKKRQNVFINSSLSLSPFPLLCSCVSLQLLVH